MTKYLAHSGKNGYPPQSYLKHISHVTESSGQYANKATSYAWEKGRMLENVVVQASYYHDLGKLDEKNQRELQKKESTRKPLPINHVDAGAAFLIKKELDEYWFPALIVYSHHKGLPDCQKELARGDALFRDEWRDTRNIVDEELDQLIAIHDQLLSPVPALEPECYEGDWPMFLRIALSCLVDADHSDTAMAYGQYPLSQNEPELLPRQRLNALDCYVNTLGKDDERSKLRMEMYLSCRNSALLENIVCCDSPVGSGKTTAIMAHLLKQAKLRGARRIFVVLPYTNIISQSVDTYRKALVLPGEDPEKVVAELHHKVDFENEDTRYLTTLWRAPIIVTTAVTFFETLASSQPSVLRKLHELPGSLIFIDEAHAALPIHLLPLVWRWMNVLAREWGCYWVLASGSLIRFWDIQDLFEKTELKKTETTSDLVPSCLRNKLMIYEKKRVTFRFDLGPKSREVFVDWIHSFPGPRLVIMNTVQSAAVIADDIRKKYGKERVEHLSTALAPISHKTAIYIIKKRLADKHDTDWTLVATSCVEAGVNFSFQTGFREAASLLSLLQAAGRINREGTREAAEMWSFFMQDDRMLRRNPDIKEATCVLKDYLKKQTEITPQLCTEFITEQLQQYDIDTQKTIKLLEAENHYQFKTVEEVFIVVDSDKVPVIVDEKMAEQVKNGKGNWKEFQKFSVTVPKQNVTKWKLRKIKEGIYYWTLKYDDFLGYMAGVLAQ